MVVGTNYRGASDSPSNKCTETHTALLQQRAVVSIWTVGMFVWMFAVIMEGGVWMFA